MKTYLSMFLALVIATPTFAGRCEPHETVVNGLLAQYGETLQVRGYSGNGNTMEVYASITTGSWTVIVVDPTGIACGVASGQNYELLVEPPKPPGTPT